ncbi:MAG: hypothetical protein GF331_16870 [Chitinivibrionales bacterium]|nr:hypothetical protein [Chitinivibrionales bacterium]
MNAVLIGGGNAAVVMLQHLSSGADVSVVEVVDISGKAPGVQLARSMGIATSDDLCRAIARPDTQLIFELTGREAVREQIRGAMRSGQELVDSTAARLLTLLLDRMAGQREEALQRFSSVHQQLGEALDAVRAADEDMRDVLVEARVLALNGKIEAAHAGDRGAAFGVVVSGMLQMIARMTEAAQKIAASAEGGRATMAQLRAAREQYRVSDDTT